LLLLLAKAGKSAANYNVSVEEMNQLWKEENIETSSLYPFVI
jgi:hypothetical protein